MLELYINIYFSISRILGLIVGFILWFKRKESNPFIWFLLPELMIMLWIIIILDDFRDKYNPDNIYL